MTLTYFKRYRMEFDLRRQRFPPADPPPSYRFVRWRDSLIAAHAATKFDCFRFEIDANVFPCLGARNGCQRLMTEIAGRAGFMPEATWLLTWQPPDGTEPEYCGTIQGVHDGEGTGSVQNLGIVPLHRGQGLGSCLLFKAMEGFIRANMKRVSLEVTAQNTSALRLYRRLGFRTVKTVYKAVEVAYA